MTYKAVCERCAVALSGSAAAFVCANECTFCSKCARDLAWSCPNCGGELARRPRPFSPPAGVSGSVRMSSSAIRVDRATPRDLDELVPLFEGYRAFYREPPDPVATREFLRERLARGDSVVFVARADGHVLGFAQLYPTFSSTRLGRMWILNDLFVTPMARRRGLASRLLRRSQTLVRETGALGAWLETAVDNPAQRLYAAHGWKLDREFLHFDWVRNELPAGKGSAATRRPVRATRRRRPARRAPRGR